MSPNLLEDIGKSNCPCGVCQKNVCDNRHTLLTWENQDKAKARSSKLAQALLTLDLWCSLKALLKVKMLCFRICTSLDISVGITINSLADCDPCESTDSCNSMGLGDEARGCARRLLRKLSIGLDQSCMSWISYMVFMRFQSARREVRLTRLSFSGKWLEKGTLEMQARVAIRGKQTASASWSSSWCLRMRWVAKATSVYLIPFHWSLFMNWDVLEARSVRKMCSRSAFLCTM
jgi:hypothetical protein